MAHMEKNKNGCVISNTSFIKSEVYTVYAKTKHAVYSLIREDDTNNIAASIFDGFIIALIVVNVVLIIVDTFPKVPKTAQVIFRYIETISIIIFTMEYLLRLWTANLIYPDYPAWKAHIKHFFSFMAIVDLFAILPFFLPLVIPIDLRVLRIVRLFRLLRIIKMNRYTHALSSIGTVFKKKAAQILSSLFIVLFLMVITSILMYSIENQAQPDVFENAFSGLWWSIATLTTVGYGDIYPITVWGKVLSGIIAMLGIGLVAIPTGIISSGFMEEMQQGREPEEKKCFCPYCGKRID